MPAIALSPMSSMIAGCSPDEVITAEARAASSTLAKPALIVAIGAAARAAAA